MKMAALVVVVFLASGGSMAATPVAVVSISATQVVQPKAGSVWTTSRTGQPPDSVRIVNTSANPLPVVMTGSTMLIPSNVRVTDISATQVVQPKAGSVWTTSRTGQPPEVVDQAGGKRWAVEDTLYQSASESSTVVLCSVALGATVTIDSDTVFYWLQVGPPDAVTASDMVWSSEVSMDEAARGSGWPVGMYSPRVGDRLSSGRTLYCVPRYRDMPLYLLQHKR